MANEYKEIGDIVKKCKILLLDIEGTTTSISFVKDKLFPYAEQNVKQFLDSQWENADVKDAVVALRKLSIEDKEGSVEGVVVIPGEDASKEEQIEGLVNNVKWQMSSDRKAGPLKQLQGLIWKQGYDNGDIKGHVYDDVSAALEAWHSAEDQKVYIYSSGSVQAQKMLFGQSMAGDLLKFIDGHFDTAVGAKQEAASYTNIVEKIGCKADEVLFLTDIVKEAEAARAAGLQAALVSREGNAPLPAEAAATFPVLHSLADLTVSNKRKPEPQEETPAAKILKTDVEDDVKSTTETAKTEDVPAATAEPAKMEVEETITSTAEAKKSPEVKEQIIVEELDSNEATSVTSVVDIEPTAVELPKEEKEEKTEEKETEKETADEPKKENGDAVKKETSAVVDVMEVEEVTDEVAQIAEDIEPIVDEPDNVRDIDDLQNVGEVLEKECDEILSKVNDVTNLANMAVKTALLKPIAEETMETENTDSNDIVDRILDTEMDLEMKQCADIDPTTVTEITEEAKSDVVEKNGVKEESPTEKEEIIVAEKKDVVAEKEIETEVKETVAQESEVVSDKKKTTSEKSETVSQKEETVSEKEEMITENNAEVAVRNPVEEVVVQNKETQVEISTADAATATETKEIKTADDNNTTTEKTAEEIKPSEEVKAVKESISEETSAKKEEPKETAPQESKVETEEPQLNGKAANGDANEKPMNGDASKDEELSARLTDTAVENGKVNGSNEDSTDGEKGQGDCKVEAETNDIKVKSVTKDEPRTDPIEQPTEA